MTPARSVPSAPLPILLRCVIAGAFALGAGSGCDDAEAAEREPVPRAREYRSAAVDTMLEAAGRVVRTRGFAPDGEPWRGFLVHRDSEVVDVSMHSGTCYVILAASSSGLEELDLRVFDSAGGEVAKDGHSGRRAALQYCPAQTGTYYVAARASSGNGLFSVRRFRGPTGLDVRLDDVFRDERAEPPPEQP